jgi:hypothetical protein
MKTNQDVTINFKDYGEIVVPKGTQLTYQTATGHDRKYHFVNEFGWIRRNYPKINLLLYHDANYYGIDIPKEFVDYETDFAVRDENL